MTIGLIQERRRSGEAYWYPNGHQLIFSKTEGQLLREQLERAQATLVSVEDQRDAAERSNRALRGVVTRERKRVSNGVCPCCNRHFEQLGRHMKNKHPNYAEVSTGV